MPTKTSSRWVSLAVVLVSGFALAGCELFREDDLDAFQTADCAQETTDFHGLSYWGLGKNGPLINWSGCEKPGADLRGSDLGIAWLVETDLGGADLRDANLAGAKLEGADLSQADLRGAQLVGADLRSINLSGADLRGLDFGGTSLRGADLSNARLNGANLRGVNLTEAKLEGADFSGAKWVSAPAVCSDGSVGDCQY
ncbi:MAG: pentapeptide repeat-containing protein [Kiloniellales bacterium]|nr:pentapeptide repeat-containing protein [Kiloniellales bacterium]